MRLDLEAVADYSLLIVFPEECSEAYASCERYEERYRRSIAGHVLDNYLSQTHDTANVVKTDIGVEV